MQDTVNDQSGDHPCETGSPKNKRHRRQLLKGVITSFCAQLKSTLVLEYVLFCKIYTTVCLVNTFIVIDVHVLYGFLLIKRCPVNSTSGKKKGLRLVAFGRFVSNSSSD